MAAALGLTLHECKPMEGFALGALAGQQALTTGRHAERRGREMIAYFVWDNGGPLHVSDFLIGVMCGLLLYPWLFSRLENNPR